MPNAEQKTIFTADAQGMINALTKISDSVTRSEEKLSKMSQASENMDKRQGGIVGKMTQWAAGAAATLGSYLSIQKVMELMTRELELQRELQRESREAGKGLQAARAELTYNLTTLPPEERATVMKIGEDLAKQNLGLGERDIQLAMAGAMSSAEAKPEVAKAALEEAIAIAPQKTAEDLSMLAGAFAAMSRITGTIDMDVNAGYLQTVGALSNLKKLDEQVKAIPRPIKTMQSYGVSAQEAGAFFSAMTTSMEDVTGRRAGTGSMEFVKTLMEVLPSEGAKAERKGTGRGRYIKPESPAFGPDNALNERIKWLQADKDRALAFLKERDFGQAQGAVRQLLLEPDSAFAKGYVQNLTAFPSMPEMKRRGQVTKQAIASDPYFFQTQVSRTGKAIQDEVAALDLIGSVTEDVQDDVKKYTDRFGSTLDHLVGWSAGWAGLDKAGQIQAQKTHGVSSVMAKGAGEMMELAGLPAWWEWGTIPKTTEEYRSTMQQPGMAKIRAEAPEAVQAMLRRADQLMELSFRAAEIERGPGSEEEKRRALGGMLDSSFSSLQKAMGTSHAPPTIPAQTVRGEANVLQGGESVPSQAGGQPVTQRGPTAATSPEATSPEATSPEATSPADDTQRQILAELKRANEQREAANRQREEQGRDAKGTRADQAKRERDKMPAIPAGVADEY